MTKLSLREAAKMAGRGKSTIHAAIKDGRLSAGRNDQGAFEIDPVELHRVFPYDLDIDGTPRGTRRDVRQDAQAAHPVMSIALDRPSSRTGRAGSALSTAERELAEALRQLDQLKQDRERDSRHARELAEREIDHLRQTLDGERTAKNDLAAAHEAHLRDLRREVEQVRAMLPAPETTGKSRSWWARLQGR